MKKIPNLVEEYEISEDKEGETQKSFFANGKIYYLKKLEGEFSSRDFSMEVKGLAAAIIEQGFEFREKFHIGISKKGDFYGPIPIF